MDETFKVKYLCFNFKVYFCGSKIEKMKKFAFVIAVAFILALALSSCNNEVCPAYATTDTDTEHVG